MSLPLFSHRAAGCLRGEDGRLLILLRLLLLLLLELLFVPPVASLLPAALTAHGRVSILGLKLSLAERANLLQLFQSFAVLVPLVECLCLASSNAGRTAARLPTGQGSRPFLSALRLLTGKLRARECGC
jgi:hypothetical protein